MIGLREKKLIYSTLMVGLKRDISSTKTGKMLQKKGFLTKSGKTSAKGKVALKILKELKNK